jgi:hypothetical protein
MYTHVMQMQKLETQNVLCSIYGSNRKNYKRQKIPTI